MRGTSHGPVSVCLSVTSQSSTKTAKSRITQTKPHDSSGTLVFWCQKGGDHAVEFRGDLWHQKTRVPGLSCGVVCVILRLAVLVELRLVTDTDTDTGPWLVPRMHSIAR